MDISGKFSGWIRPQFNEFLINMKNKSWAYILILCLIVGIGVVLAMNNRNSVSTTSSQKSLSYSDLNYGVSFSYPKEWGMVTVAPGNTQCPEEDTYRTPDTLSIYDRELKFPDHNLKNSESIIRSGVRLYRINPNVSNNCNDEVLRKLAVKEITGEEFSSFRLMPTNISNFYGVYNENASRLDTEGRKQFTLFIKELDDRILIIQPYMSFIPFADSLEWREIDSKYKGDILSYVENGDTAEGVREFAKVFKQMAESIKYYK